MPRDLERLASIVWIILGAICTQVFPALASANSSGSAVGEIDAPQRETSLSRTRTETPAWRTVEPDYSWSFPRDHGVHPGFRNEWWYFVGHLEDSNGRRFGYQLTLFRIGIAPVAPAWESSWVASDLVMGHLAITDVDENRHVFAEALVRATPLLGGFGGPDSLLAWCQAPAGTEGHWTIRWTKDRFELQARDQAAGIALALSASPLRAPLLQGPNGYSRKSDHETAASHYYSVTRLETRGRIEIARRARADTSGEDREESLPRSSGDLARSRNDDLDPIEVTGLSWMDHEFSSNQLGMDQVGWDWFALQLDDGRDVMLYLLRNEEGIDYAHGTLREAEGSVRWLEPRDWTLQASPASRSSRYPSKWILEIPDQGLEVEIAPLVSDQENVSEIVPGLRYWEGAVEVRVRGRAIGQGYVELTGYGGSGRLPF